MNDAKAASPFERNDRSPVHIRDAKPDTDLMSLTVDDRRYAMISLSGSYVSEVGVRAAIATLTAWLESQPTEVR